MFSRMLSAFGAGGPSVDTVLDSPHTAPGQVITGKVNIQGGQTEAEISQIVLALVTSVEAGYGDRELYRAAAHQALRVSPGQVVSIPFQLQVPYEAPITAVGGVWLPGVSVGVRTEIVVAGAPDEGDLDLVQVEPTPGQARVLETMGQLGFKFRKAGVDSGRLPGVRHELGFYQELEFLPPSQYAGVISEVELTFVAGPHELYVILDADGRAGGQVVGGEPFGLFHVTQQAVLTVDWSTLVSQWLAQVVATTGGGHGSFAGHGVSGGSAAPVNPAFGAGPFQVTSTASGAAGGYPTFGAAPTFSGHQPSYDHHGHAHHDRDHHDHHERPRSGMGGMVVNELFDDEEGGEGGGEG
jgi:sporulation-control protein